MQDITDNKKSLEPKTEFIIATLKGGQYDGQAVRVPADEFILQFTYSGRPVTYTRYNSAPVFHAEDKIVALLGGKGQRR
jgi:hypothetical protein